MKTEINSIEVEVLKRLDRIEKKLTVIYVLAGFSAGFLLGDLIGQLIFN